MILLRKQTARKSSSIFFRKKDISSGITVEVKSGQRLSGNL